MGIDNFKKKLLLMDKDRKTNSRLAMKFGFDTGKTLDNVDPNQKIKFINDKNKVIQDCFNTNEEHQESCFDNAKICKQNNQSDSYSAFDFNLDSHVTSSFIVPFFRTEDCLIGTKSSASNFSPTSLSSSNSFTPSLSSASQSSLSLKSNVMCEVGSDISLPSALSDSLIQPPIIKKDNFKTTDTELESYSEFLSEFDSLGENYKTIVEYLDDDQNVNHGADRKRILSLEDVSIYVTPKSHCSFQNRVTQEGDGYDDIVIQAKKIKSQEELCVKLDIANDEKQFCLVDGNELLNNNDDDHVDEEIDDDDDNRPTENEISFAGDETSEVQDVSREEAEVELMKVLQDNLDSEDLSMLKTEDDDDYKHNASLTQQDDRSEKEAIFSSHSDCDDPSIITSKSILMDDNKYLYENKSDQDCQTGNSLEFYLPVTTFSPVKTSTQRLQPFISIDKSIQTDDLLMQSSRSPLTVVPEQLRKSSQSSQTEMPIGGSDFRETSSNQVAGDFKDNGRHEQMRNSLDRTDSRCQDEMFQGHGRSSRTSIHSLNSTLSMAEETSLPLVEVKFESANDFNKWRLMQLIELERKKQEIMNMNERDMELLKLRKEEKDLKNQLRKIIKRRKELEGQKASMGSGDTRSLVDLCSVGKSFVTNEETSDLVCSYFKSSLEPIDRSSIKNTDSDRMIESNSRKSPLIGDSVSHFSANNVQNRIIESDNSLTNSMTIEKIINIASPIKSSPSSVKTFHHKCVVTGPHEKAAFDFLCSKLAPIVRGYIVRRLFRCQKVRDTIKTLVDVSKEMVVVLPIVYSDAGDRKDNLLLEGLKRQFASASSRLVDIFRSPSSDLLKIIADQRIIDQRNVFKDYKPHKRQLSLATRKTIERKEIAEKSASLSSVSLKSSQSHAIPSSIVQSSSRSQHQKNRTSNLARKSNLASRSMFDNNVKVSISSQNSKTSRATPTISKNTKSLRNQPAPSTQQRINPQETKPQVAHPLRRR